MRRMVKDYTEQYYLPAAQNSVRFDANHYEQGRELATWKTHMRQRWSSVHLDAQLAHAAQSDVGEPIVVSPRVWLNGLAADNVAVEIVAGIQDRSGELASPQVVTMQPTGDADGALLYEGALTPENSGVLAFGVHAGPAIRPWSIPMNWV